MDGFVHPRLADHAQGLELRIIELSRRIERAQRWRSPSGRLAALERQRQRLFRELAETTAAPEALRPVRVDGRRVRHTGERTERTT